MTADQTQHFGTITLQATSAIATTTKISFGKCELRALRAMLTHWQRQAIQTLWASKALRTDEIARQLTLTEAEVANHIARLKGRTEPAEANHDAVSRVMQAPRTAGN